jgi:large subunit ribosomal protein L7/L12
VDGAPGAVKEGISKEEAEGVKSQLEEVGASVEIK